MSLNEEIIAVKKLLSDPSKFTTGAMARDANGLPVAPSDDNAVCWCLVGAIRKTDPNWRPGNKVYQIIRTILGGTVSVWSDKNGYDKVMELLDFIEKESRN